MGQIRKRLLIGLMVILFVWPGIGRAQKFFPDDPISANPPDLPVAKVQKRSIDAVIDFLANSMRPNPRPPVPAREVNTLGEVPDSSWFTNRQARKRLTPAELRRGPGTDNAPVPPYTIVGGKSEGVTPGFQMKDSKGREYFVKPDPMSYPEITTSAEVIVSKFLWAIGYNTPENYIITPHISDLQLAEEATISAADGGKRKMLWRDVKDLVDRIPHYSDGSFRVLASLAASGESVGPFQYSGVRSDDPNDIVPHENRRDLRGLSVIAAWLNHTDAKSENSLDTVVEDHGVRKVRHYLIDFGSSLGSDSDKPKDARFGHEFMLPSAGEALGKIAGLGIVTQDWERARFPDIRGVGNIDWETFDPEKWKPQYPNPAFLSRLPDDEYWGAKQVMAFSDDDIRTIVETGRFTDPRAVDYLTRTLIQRRDRIGRTYFAKVLPFDNFSIGDGALHFDDLGSRYGLLPAQEYTIDWFLFDNEKEAKRIIGGAQTLRLPPEAAEVADGGYFGAEIRSIRQPSKSVTVFFRKNHGSYVPTGIDRTW